MNTKTICNTLNISSKALRLYEEIGIVVPKRDENNYRNYSEDDMLKLRQVLLLKEMGVPLKNIKELLNRDFHGSNRMIESLDFQLKAVENRISELVNIREALKESINEIINTKEINCKNYFTKIDTCLRENKEKRKNWLDKWGFDLWAETYDSSVYKNDDDLRLLEKYDYVIETVAGKIIENKAVNVIDIGCGTCNIYGKLNSGINYTGVDQSIEMLLKAREKFKNINLSLGNFLDEPFKKQNFDIVISTYAFHHLQWEEKQRAINLLLKFLKPKGKIIIADLMFLNNKERLNKKEELLKAGRYDLWNIIEDEYYTNIEELESYIEKLGYKMKYSKLVNFSWMLEIIV